MSLRARIGVLGAIALLSLPQAARAECMERWTRARLERQLSLAEAALAGEDRREQRRLMDELAAELPCTAEILPPALAARLHRVQGLAAARLRRDATAARGALAAAARLEPTPPPGLLQAGEQAWYQAPAAVEGLQLARTAGTTWFVDGQQADSRAPGAAALLQGSAPSGAVCRTAYLWSDSEIAPPCGADGLATAPRPRASGPFRGRGAQMLAGVGAAALVKGGAFYGGAWIRASQYRGPDGAPLYSQQYYEDTLRPWAAGGGITALAGLGALGGGILWAATGSDQRPLLQLSGSF
jgi:hypothetical protein